MQYVRSGSWTRRIWEARSSHPASSGSTRFGEPRRLGAGGSADEQVGLVPDEIVLAVDGELVVLAHEDRRHRARFLAVTAEDAARLVNLINLGVSRTGHDAAVVLGGFEVDRVGGTRHRAQA